MAIFLLVGMLLGQVEATAETLGGETVEGKLTAITDEAVEIAASTGKRTLARGDLKVVRFDRLQDPPIKDPAIEHILVTLADDTTFVPQAVRVKGAQAELDRHNDETLRVETRSLDSMRFPARTQEQLKEWNAIRTTADRGSDVLVVRAGDSLDSLEGVVVEVADDAIQFRIDEDTVRVKREKVAGILFHKVAQRALPPPRAVVHDKRGSVYQIANMSLENDKLRMRTVGGMDLEESIDSIWRLDFASANLQYLGDLKRESVTWSPYFGAADQSPGSKDFYRPRVDRALESGPLRLGGRTYAKGLALHSRTEVVYRLPGKFRTFQAVVGIDDRVRPAGDVRLTIHGDDRVLFDGRISGKDEPKPLDLDISAVNRLKITVDFGDELDVSDHLNLCDARMVK